MTTTLYYFSGTGNSLHLAKELQKRLPDTHLVSMVSALHEGISKSNADRVGFVFPIHCLGIPLVVKRFLKSMDLGSASYVFAIASRECSVKVFNEMDKIFEPQGKKVDATFAVPMPQTYLPVFEVEEKEEMERKEIAMLQELDRIKEIVSTQKQYRKPDPKVFGMFIYYMMRPILVFLFNKTRYFHLEKKFYAEENCTGCGLCEKVCLSGKIKMIDGKPVWDKKVNCYFCFACIHYCPVKAIQIKGSKSKERGRYHHSDVPAAEIMKEKQSSD